MSVKLDNRQIAVLLHYDDGKFAYLLETGIPDGFDYEGDTLLEYIMAILASSPFNDEIDAALDIMNRLYLSTLKKRHRHLLSAA